MPIAGKRARDAAVPQDADLAKGAPETLEGYETDGCTADKERVYVAMKNLSEAVDVLRDKLFKEKKFNADLPEEQALGTLIATLAIGEF